jgi:hypothetical protein
LHQTFQWVAEKQRDRRQTDRNGRQVPVPETRDQTERSADPNGRRSRQARNVPGRIAQDDARAEKSDAGQDA